MTLTRPTADQPGRVTADLSGRVPNPSILLTDAATGEPIALDYRTGTSALPGGLAVTIPVGTELPERVRAYVLAGVSTLAARDL